MRGGADDRLRWRAGAFRSENRDDILFVGTSTSAGYFTNFGRTRRSGLEFELSGRAGIWSWQASANLLRAEFASSACLLAANNSTRGQDAACTASGQDDEILVSAGDRLPGIPERSFKLSGRALAENPFDAAGNFQTNSDDWRRETFTAPGAPRAGWVGLNYRFATSS